MSVDEVQDTAPRIRQGDTAETLRDDTEQTRGLIVVLTIGDVADDESR